MQGTRLWTRDINQICVDRNDLLRRRKAGSEAADDLNHATCALSCAVWSYHPRMPGVKLASGNARTVAVMRKSFVSFFNGQKQKKRVQKIVLRKSEPRGVETGDVCGRMFVRGCSVFTFITQRYPNQVWWYGGREGNFFTRGFLVPNYF